MIAVGSECVAQQATGGVDARALVELAGQHARGARQARVVHGLQVAGPAGRGARAVTAVDVDDPLVPERDEVLDRQVRADRLVHQHAVQRRRAHAAADHDARQRADRGRDLRPRQVRGHEDQPVGAVLQQRFEHRVLALLAPAAGDDQQPLPELGGLRLDAVRDLGEERVVEIVEQHAHRVRPVRGEVARDRVRPIAEQGRRVAHPPAALVADLGAAAHDQGHERAGHPGLTRNVVHGHVAASRHLRGVCSLERSNGGGRVGSGLPGRLAAAPISWGVCEVPGWGLQLPPDRVFAEMAELGITATELGPLGWLPAGGAQAKAVLDRYGLHLVGGFVPVVVHEPELDREYARRAAAQLAQAGGELFVAATVHDARLGPTPTARRRDVEAGGRPPGHARGHRA